MFHVTSGEITVHNLTSTDYWAKPEKMLAYLN